MKPHENRGEGVHNLLIADFFKKEVCARKIGKMRRIRPRESGMAQESRRTYLKNRQSASESNDFGNFHMIPKWRTAASKA